MIPSNWKTDLTLIVIDFIGLDVFMNAKETKNFFISTLVLYSKEKIVEYPYSVSDSPALQNPWSGFHQQGQNNAIWDDKDPNTI